MKIIKLLVICSLICVFCCSIAELRIFSSCFFQLLMHCILHSLKLPCAVKKAQLIFSRRYLNMVDIWPIFWKYLQSYTVYVHVVSRGSGNHITLMPFWSGETVLLKGLGHEIEFKYFDKKILLGLNRNLSLLVFKANNLRGPQIIFQLFGKIF